MFNEKVMQMLDQAFGEEGDIIAIIRNDREYTAHAKAAILLKAMNEDSAQFEISLNAFRTTNNLPVAPPQVIAGLRKINDLYFNNKQSFTEFLEEAEAQETEGTLADFQPLMLARIQPHIDSLSQAPAQTESMASNRHIMFTRPVYSEDPAVIQAEAQRRLAEQAEWRNYNEKIDEMDMLMGCGRY